MFTGLIEAVGEVRELTPSAGGLRLLVATELAGDLPPGASLAVNGVCLTTVSAAGGHVVAEISPETARVTTLGRLGPGQIVNLERPLRADGRIGGHIVQGHVDATGTIEGLREDEGFYWLTIGFPEELTRFVVSKGSIAVDGISLTVAGLAPRRLDVQVVPFTWTHTNLRAAEMGDAVNLECDILGKYVVQAAALAAGGALRDPQ